MADDNVPLALPKHRCELAFGHHRIGMSIA